MGKLIAGILLETIKGFNIERKTKLHREHQDVIENLNKAVNAAYPEYTDAAVGLAEEKKDAFLVAFHLELIQHNKELGNA